MKLGHSYHLVQVSPWPITSGLSLLSLIIGNILVMNNKEGGKSLIILAILSLIYSVYYWFKDIIIEGTYKGEHTKKVQKSLSLGFILFVISEICVFFSLFFAYFYNALVPSVEVGGIWPPIGIITLDYKAIPLLNTIILLSSGFSITACHNYILNKDYNRSILYLLITIILGLIFIYFQYIEYFSSSFTIADSVFGSSFFILTGCHGLHIIIGTTFLFLTLLRFSHFSNHHHLQFSSAAIYWHFLDAIWLLLYFILYCWAA
jgi:cytochrome c oxidase subunit 3